MPVLGTLNYFTVFINGTLNIPVSGKLTCDNVSSLLPSDRRLQATH